MPGVRVDLPDVDDAAEVHLNPTAGSASVEKEIFARLVTFVGQFAIVEFGQAAAVGIGFAIHNGKFRLPGRIAGGRRRNVDEFEARRGVVIIVVADGDLDFRPGGEAGREC